jgi:hypothetical protein
MSQSTLGKSRAAPELSLHKRFSLPEDEPGELVEGRLEEEEVPDYLHKLLVALLVGPWATGSPRVAAWWPGPRPSLRSVLAAAGNRTSLSTCRAATVLRPAA